IWLAFGAVSTAVQAEWAGVLLYAATSTIVVAVLCSGRWRRSRFDGRAMRRGLRRFDRVEPVVHVSLALAAVSCTSGGIRALAHTQWGSAFGFLLGAIVFASVSLLPTTN